MSRTGHWALKSGRARSAAEEHAVAPEIREHVRRIEIWLALETPAQPPAGVSYSKGQVGRDCAPDPKILDEITAPGLKPIGGNARSLLRRLVTPRLSINHSRALPSDVHDATLRHVPAWPTGATSAETKVNLLEVEEVILVHQTDGIKDFSTDDHAATRNPVDPIGSILIHPARDNTAREEPVKNTKAQAIEQLVCRSNEPEGKRPIGAVWVLNTSAGNSDLGISFHKLQKDSESSWPHLGIGVEQ